MHMGLKKGQNLLVGQYSPEIGMISTQLGSTPVQNSSGDTQLGIHPEVTCLETPGHRTSLLAKDIPVTGLLTAQSWQDIPLSQDSYSTVVPQDISVTGQHSLSQDNRQHSPATTVLSQDNTVCQHSLSHNTVCHSAATANTVCHTTQQQHSLSHCCRC